MEFSVLARASTVAFLCFCGCVSPSVPNVQQDAGASTGAPSVVPFTPADDGGAIGVPSGDDGAVGPPGVVTVDDASADADPASAYSVSLQMTNFTVAPGEELYKCQDFANPFGGQAIDITRYQVVMNAGSHHMLLFYTSGASDGPLIDCPQGGLQIGPFTFGAQTQKVTEDYPAGLGAAIPADMGFTLNAHYINSGSSPLEAAVKVTMFVAQPGTITQHVGVLQFVQISLSVPPTNQPSTSTASCALTQDMSLLWAGSHMHKRATHFVAVTGSTMLYETDSWDDPVPRTFSPPLALSANSQIQWSCTYVNETGTPLTFGESAATNVMCNFGATFFPLQDVNNPVIRCLQ